MLVWYSRKILQVSKSVSDMSILIMLETFDKCRSTTGYVFTLSQALKSCYSILQFTVALSTMEIEYMGMTETIKKAIWLQRVA